MIRRQLLQIEQLQFRHIPILGAIKFQELRVKLGLVEARLADLTAESERLENRNCNVFPLDPYSVQLAKDDVWHGIASGFAGNDSSAVSLGDAFQTRGEVDRVTHHGVRLALPGAHVAHPHVTGVDTDTDGQRRPPACDKFLV